MIQGASGRYSNLLDATLTIARTEGMGAFMKGWQPRLIWISMGGFVFFPVLEATKKVGRFVSFLCVQEVGQLCVLSCASLCGYKGGWLGKSGVPGGGVRGGVQVARVGVAVLCPVLEATQKVGRWLAERERGGAQAKWKSKGGFAIRVWS